MINWDKFKERDRNEALEWQRRYLGDYTGVNDPDGIPIHVGDKLHMSVFGDEYTCYAVYQDNAHMARQIKLDPYYAYGQLYISGGFHRFSDSEGRQLRVIQSWEVLAKELEETYVH